MTEKELKTKVRKMILSDEQQALILANALMALLMQKNIITSKELNQMKKEVVDIMVDKWVEKYKDDPKAKEQFEASALIEKFFTL